MEEITICRLKQISSQDISKQDEYLKGIEISRMDRHRLHQLNINVCSLEKENPQQNYLRSTIDRALAMRQAETEASQRRRKIYLDSRSQLGTILGCYMLAVVWIFHYYFKMQFTQTGKAIQTSNWNIGLGVASWIAITLAACIFSYGIIEKSKHAN